MSFGFRAYLQVKRIYTFGESDFGMSKLDVYREIMMCPFCDDSAKQIHKDELSLLEEQEQSIATLKIGAYQDKAEQSAISYNVVEENVCLGLDSALDIDNAPLSMVLNVPTVDSIWYNQQGKFSVSIYV